MPHGDCLFIYSSPYLTIVSKGLFEVGKHIRNYTRLSVNGFLDNTVIYIAYIAYDSLLGKCVQKKFDNKLTVPLEPILNFKKLYEMNSQFKERDCKIIEGLRDLGFYKLESVPFMNWKGIVKDRSALNNES